MGGHLPRLTLETRPRIPATAPPLCPPQAMELLQTTHTQTGGGEKNNTEESVRPQKCKKKEKKRIITTLNLSCVVKLTGDVRYSLFRYVRPVLLFRSGV